MSVFFGFVHDARCLGKSQINQTLFSRALYCVIPLLEEQDLV